MSKPREQQPVLDGAQTEPPPKKRLYSPDIQTLAKLDKLLAPLSREQAQANLIWLCRKWDVLLADVPASKEGFPP